MSTSITVEGMSCGGCEQTVEDALTALDGVTSANANRETDGVEIEGDVDLDALLRTVEDAGYRASA